MGKLENLKREMENVKLDIVGIIEVKWKNEQDFWSGDFRTIITRANKGITGEGLVMNKRMGNRIGYSDQYSDRIIMARVETKPRPTTIIQVYLPTLQYQEEELEKCMMG